MSPLCTVSTSLRWQGANSRQDSPGIHVAAPCLPSPLDHPMVDQQHNQPAHCTPYPGACCGAGCTSRASLTSTGSTVKPKHKSPGRGCSTALSSASLLKHLQKDKQQKPHYSKIRVQAAKRHRGCGRKVHQDKMLFHTEMGNKTTRDLAGALLFPAPRLSSGRLAVAYRSPSAQHQ